MATERNGAAVPHEVQQLCREPFSGGSMRAKLLLIGAIAPVLLWATACAGNDEGQPSISDTATATPLATPESTPGMSFTKMPKLRPEIKDWESAVNYYNKLKTDEKMIWLVDNARWSVDINMGAGFEGSTKTALHFVLRIKPSSAEDVAIIDSEACRDLREAVSPLVPQDLERRVVVQNSQAQPGQDPLEVDLHLTHEDAQKYREKTDCEPTLTS